MSMPPFKNVLISEKKKIPVFEKNILSVAFISFSGFTNSAVWICKVFKTFYT